MHINWKKYITIGLDVLLAAYIIAAFTSFNRPDVTMKVCTKANIEIQDETANGFINAKEIKTRLEKRHLYPLGVPMQAVNARKIEETLKQSPFVKTAECYKTQDGQVCISLTQRMPTVRIKSINGDDYYLDDNNSIMPNSHYTSDLIIATGFISKWYARKYVAFLARALMADDLWKNQIEQINVTHESGIELVPRVGNHIVYLGSLPEGRNDRERKQKIDEFVNKKMTRLVKFYKYGLSHAGWNKYSNINLEFDNQIICKKRNTN